MKQLVRYVKILDAGLYTPEKVYTNEYLESLVPTNSIWIYENIKINHLTIFLKLDNCL